jgi:type II restriction enzyme
MDFKELRSIIKNEANKDFVSSTNIIEKIIFSLKRADFSPLITEIGSIPEDIAHDSSEEKLFSKASDIVLAKCFHELGYKAEVIKERANCADVSAKSLFHNYTLVGDAKSFRLSRTAKNAKDFKVTSMASWRGTNDYAVLVCPYYQYPKSKSQIYGQALDNNITLFSWEYLSILLDNGICENECVNISSLWNICVRLSKKTEHANRNRCFFDSQDEIIKLFLKFNNNQYNEYFKNYKINIISRGENEIKYWEEIKKEISNYSREKAIEELLISLKLNEKIISIRKYINSLKTEEDNV